MRAFGGVRARALPPRDRCRTLGDAMRKTCGIAAATLAAVAAVLLAAGAAGGASLPRVKEYVVPAGSRPHDVAPAAQRHGLVHRAGHREAGEAGSGERQRDRSRARRRLGAPRRHRRAGRRCLGDRRRPQRDRARRSPHTRRQAVPAPGLERVREPQHGHVRPARPALVHGTERHLRPPQPRSGALRVFRAPGGPGPYGIATTPGGQVWYSSLAGSYIARIDSTRARRRSSGRRRKGEGARRVWADSRGRLWVSEWNAGRVARYDPSPPLAGVAAPGRRAAVRRLRRRPRHRLAHRLRRRRDRALRPGDRALRAHPPARGCERAAAARPARGALGRRVRSRPDRVRVGRTSRSLGGCPAGEDGAQASLDAGAIVVPARSACPGRAEHLAGVGDHQRARSRDQR